MNIETYLIISMIGVYIIVFIFQEPLVTSDNDVLAGMERIVTSFVIAGIFSPFGIIIIPVGVVFIIIKIKNKKRVIKLRASKLRREIYRHFGA
jgi:hypothetical protein